MTLTKTAKLILPSLRKLTRYEPNFSVSQMREQITNKSLYWQVDNPLSLIYMLPMILIPLLPCVQMK